MIASTTPPFIQRYQDQLQNYYGTQQNPNAGGTAQSSYAVGNRVYNGSSPSPQAGAGGLDPTGYQTRDNMAQTKNRLLAGYLNQ